MGRGPAASKQAPECVLRKPWQRRLMPQTLFELQSLNNPTCSAAVPRHHSCSCCAKHTLGQPDSKKRRRSITQQSRFLTALLPAPLRSAASPTAAPQSSPALSPGTRAVVKCVLAPALSRLSQQHTGATPQGWWPLTFTTVHAAPLVPTFTRKGATYESPTTRQDGCRGHCDPR